MAITAEKLRVEVEGDTASAQKALDALEKKGRSVPKWVGGAKTALMGLFGLGAGAGVALSAGLIGNIELNEVGNKVSAALALTGPQSARAGDVAGSLWSDAYGESMADVGGAVESVMSSVDGMKNANAATLKTATADVLNFAKAYEVDVDRAAQVAGQAVRQGLAPDFATAMDLMVASSSKVPKALRGDLLDAVDEYGGYFSQLGISGDSAFSMLAAASQKGMYGIDKTGDALKEFSVRMVESDKTASTALSSMGLNMGTLADDMAAGGERGNKAMQKVVSGLLGIKDPGERAAASIDLFGAPLEDLGTNNIPKFLKSLQGVPGGMGDVSQAAENMGTKLNSGPGVALEGLKRSIGLAFIGFTDTAIPALTSFASTATTYVAPAAAAISSAVGSAIGVIQGMAAFVRENSTVFLVLAGILAAVFVPGLVAMGVAATVTKVKVVAAWIAQKAAAIGSVAAQTLAMARTVVGWVGMAAAAVVSGAQTVIIWGMYQAAAIRGAAASVAAHARVVVGWVLAAAATVANGAIMMASMAATAARVVAGWVLMGLQSMLAAAKMAAAWFIALGPIGWVIAAVVALVVLIIANWDKVKAVTIAVFSAVAAFVSSTWAAITAWITGAVNNARAAVAKGVAVMKALWSAGMNAIRSVAKAVWNAIKAVVTAAVNGVKSAVTRAVNGVKSVWTSVMNSVKSVASSIWNAIKALVSRAISGVLSAVNRVRQVVGAVRNAFNSAKSAAQGALNGLVSFVRGIPGKLVSILMGAVGRFRSAGSNIINGLKSGIMGAFGNVKAAVSNGLSAIRNLLPFSPAKEGPFSGKGWTLYSGRSIPEAMADGIRDKIGKAKAAALDMAKGVSGAMTLPDVTGGALGGLGSGRRASVTPGSVQHGTGTADRGGNSFTFITHNPIAEKESVTVNKTLQRAAGLGW